MSKANEEKAILMEKRANILTDIGPRFFGELQELAGKEHVNVVPMIRQSGPPTIELVSTRPIPARTIWHKVGLKKYINPEGNRLLETNKKIQELLVKHKVVLFAHITPVGAQMQIDLSPDYDLNATALWTPPNMDKIIPATTPEVKK